MGGAAAAAGATHHPIALRHVLALAEDPVPQLLGAPRPEVVAARDPREAGNLAPGPRARPRPVATAQRRLVAHVEAGAGRAHQVAAAAGEAAVGGGLPQNVRLRRLQRRGQLLRRELELGRKCLGPRPQALAQRDQLVRRGGIERAHVPHDLAAAGGLDLDEQHAADVPHVERRRALALQTPHVPAERLGETRCPARESHHERAVEPARHQTVPATGLMERPQHPEGGEVAAVDAQQRERPLARGLLEREPPVVATVIAEQGLAHRGEELARREHGGRIVEGQRHAGSDVRPHPRGALLDGANDPIVARQALEQRIPPLPRQPVDFVVHSHGNERNRRAGGPQPWHGPRFHP